MKKRFIAITCLILAIAFIFIIINIKAYDITTNLFNFSKSVLSYYGSRGQNVIDIQDKLHKWGYYNGIVDGNYGYKTFKAIRLFQWQNGLKVDGVAGSETFSALGLSSSSPLYTARSSSIYERNMNLLAHLVHGEARGEPFIGQVAIAAVVMNRISNSRFPKTIAGVIYQPGAFEAVSDGQIDLEPDSTSLRAARDAYNGWDPTYGSIYYFNPDIATNRWIWSRSIVTVIGKHYFLR